MQQSNSKMFTFFCFLQIMISLDHGIIPASTSEIQRFFKIDKDLLGFMGSIVFLGIVANGVIAGRVYQSYQTKKVFMSGLFLSQISLILLVLTDNYKLALFARFLTGIFQVFNLIFLPVWVDRYGGSNKTKWITTYQTCHPVGIVLGYGLTSVLITLVGDWRIAFLIQIIILIFCIGIISQFDDDLISIKSLEQDQQKKLDYIQSLKIIFSSKVYRNSLISFTNLLFVVTSIQFWMTDYFIKQMRQKRQLVHISFLIVCITAPTLGTIFGGYIINKIGGYNNPLTIKALLVMVLLSIVPAQFITVIDQFWIAVSLLWNLLFWGGAMIPGLTGLIMVSVPQQLRPFGNSKAQSVKNLLGNFPSPYLYGLAITIFTDGRMGLRLILLSTIITPIALMDMIFSQIKIYSGNNEQKQPNKQIDYSLEQKNSTHKL